MHTKAGALDPFQEEQPVGEVGVYQNVEIVELDEEARVPDPGDGYFTVRELWEVGFPMRSGPGSHQGLPHHLVEKAARTEVLTWRELLEGSRDTALRRGRLVGVVRVR